MKVEELAYQDAISKINNGMSIRELKIELRMHENNEEFEKCIGINQAINEEYNSYKEEL